jgi:cytochrome c551/c552
MRIAIFLAAVSCYGQAALDQSVLRQYCVTCHNQRAKTAGLMLDTLDAAHVDQHPDVWEKVVRKVRAGMMPPSGAPRPDRATLDGFASTLETALDRAGAAHPNPGTAGLHRLNRTEYANAIRDLLSLDVDASALLPADDSSEGFDNVADALAVSPALLERYVAAASKISRAAVGDPLVSAATVTYRVPGDLSQRDHIEGLPLGTRGGILIQHTFPVDAEYSFKIRARAAAIGLSSSGFQDEDLEVTLNGERIKLVKPGNADLRLPIKAGPQTIGVAFVKKTPPGADDLWSIYASNSGVQSVAVTGPINPTGPGESPSRKRIFVCQPASANDELSCARTILSTLARRAFRAPATSDDLDMLLGFYQTGRKQGNFDSGIEQALARVLVDPRFVFRFEREPDNMAAGAAYRVSDLELASRLSFFLWSSIPDDELLNLAIAGKLHDPVVLEQQARRMLADPRSDSLATNFAGQWLYLRELKNQRPEAKDFDENLRQSFRQETELFFGSIVREDRNVVDLLNADYSFVDERLARHYGIPNVHGSQFRRVALTGDERRGLLGQGSILLVTSVATRTSPVARGKWILENLLGTAPPLPPPNVPPLKESAGQTQPASVRQRMEEHRTNPVCAACHKIMDPIGFSLENYDLVGKWRSTDGGVAIDASSQLVDGTKLDGPASLRQALLSRSDVFVQTLTEKLLTYGVGRALKYYDMPAVRAITRDAAQQDNRFSALILGIVKSPPFQMREKL